MAYPWSIRRLHKLSAALCAAAAVVLLTSSTSLAFNVTLGKNMTHAGKNAAVQHVGGVNASLTQHFTVILKNANKADADHVASYFRHYGMTVEVSSNHKFLHVTSTFGRTAAAGNTQFERVKFNGEVLTRTTHTASFPRDIAQRIQATSINPGPKMLELGISGGGRPHPQAQVNGPQTGYDPATLATVYNFNPVYSAGLDGTGQTVDVAACFNIDPADIAYYQSFYGLPSKPVHIIHVDGTLNQFGFVPGPSLEPTLDVERIMSVAPNAKINLYLVPDCLISQFVDMYAEMAEDGHAVSANTSYGFFEADYGVLGFGDLLLAQNAAIQEMADEHIANFAASGDSGSWGDSFTTGLTNFTDIIYPSSDPNVIAVGGTTLETSVIGTRLFEYGWSGSGGGVSGVFPIPPWQAATPGMASGLFKNTPDVAYVGDPNTGVATAFIVGIPPPIFPVGGTSAGSPSWAGFAALIGQNRKLHGHSSLGENLAPALYAVRSSGAYYDITVGANGYYPTRPGYDNVTGLGVPNGWKLVKALQ